MDDHFPHILRHKLTLYFPLSAGRRRPGEGTHSHVATEYQWQRRRRIHTPVNGQMAWFLVSGFRSTIAHPSPPPTNADKGATLGGCGWWYWKRDFQVHISLRIWRRLLGSVYYYYLVYLAGKAHSLSSQSFLVFGSSPCHNWNCFSRRPLLG